MTNTQRIISEADELANAAIEVQKRATAEGWPMDDATALARQHHSFLLGILKDQENAERGPR